MTAEFGPRDVDLSLLERAAGKIQQYLIPLYGRLYDEKGVRFDPTTATLSLTGTSDNAGEGFNTGLVAALIHFITVMLSLSVMVLVTETATTLVEMGLYPLLLSVPVLVLVAVSMITALGSMSLIAKTDVVDHRTAPTPDALGELKQQYVAGEIDDDELEAEAAEVWQR